MTTRRPKGFVLDSWSILAFYEGEPAAQQVEEIIARAHDEDLPLLMTVVNAGEVWYIIARQASPGEADRSVAELGRMGIEVLDAVWPLARRAAEFKSRCRMSFADCFAAALAAERGMELVTGDPEFRQVEEEVSVHWLPGAP